MASTRRGPFSVAMQGPCRSVVALSQPPLADNPETAVKALESSVLGSGKYRMDEIGVHQICRHLGWIYPQ